MLKPAGSLIFFIIAASSASEAPVGGPDGGARPFCASVSSPRNQSSGGWVQKSLVPDSSFFSGFCCACANRTEVFAESERCHQKAPPRVGGLPQKRKIVRVFVPGGRGSIGSAVARLTALFPLHR